MYEDFNRRLDTEALYGKLYSGAIFRFRDFPPMRELASFTRSFLENALAPHTPIESHRDYDDSTLAKVYAAAQREFANSPEASTLWRAVFEAAGLDPDVTARDRLILRFQPPDPPEGERDWARSTATVNFHRDTWGTNLYAQVNWWAPVYPIDAGRTFAFFPELFDRPLANSSEDFDLSEVMRRIRESPETMRDGEMVPRLLERIENNTGLPVVIAPGEVIAFSAHHAHAGIRNRTQFTRISLETRTLRIPDHRAGRGARNIDGRAHWMSPGMFRRVSDGVALTQILQVDSLEAFKHPMSG